MTDNERTSGNSSVIIMTLGGKEDKETDGQGEMVPQRHTVHMPKSLTSITN